MTKGLTHVGGNGSLPPLYCAGGRRPGCHGSLSARTRFLLLSPVGGENCPGHPASRSTRTRKPLTHFVTPDTGGSKSSLTFPSGHPAPSPRAPSPARRRRGVT